jgi:hypothetical protein
VRALRIEEGRFFVAECATDLQRNHWQWSKLDLNDCLTNVWGKTRWAKAGNFVKSCRNTVLLDDTVLEAEASDVISWHRNKVRLEERVRIVDGRLTFINGKHGAGNASTEDSDETKTSNGTDKRDDTEASACENNDDPEVSGRYSQHE